MHIDIVVDAGVERVVHLINEGYSSRSPSSKRAVKSAVL
jgi:hypothetical protein